MARPSIFLFISTGRCGTQWLGSTLASVYGDRAVATHEPLGPLYRPRSFFRAYEDTRVIARVDAITQHLDRIEGLQGQRLYIETGWPLFGAIPLFVERFGSRLGFVHLTRHPIPTAISHMVHQCYGGSPRNDAYSNLAALDPSCPRVFQPEYGRRWPTMSPFEKCLFWWTEVHLYADEIHRRWPDVVFHRLKSEQMLVGEAEVLRGLVDFLGLPFRDELIARTKVRVDRWNHQTQLRFDWRQIFAHDRTLQVSADLGYDLEAVDEGALRERYEGRPHEGAPTGYG